MYAPKRQATLCIAIQPPRTPLTNFPAKLQQHSPAASSLGWDRGGAPRPHALSTPGKKRLVSQGNELKWDNVRYSFLLLHFLLPFEIGSWDIARVFSAGEVAHHFRDLMSETSLRGRMETANPFRHDSLIFRHARAEGGIREPWRYCSEFKESNMKAENEKKYVGIEKKDKTLVIAERSRRTWKPPQTFKFLPLTNCV
ncbi:hypothetical protein E2C01_033864 [Portunus trituberculatus]|uniref:Uncharacterized protein n=1 Tax=Portunus trituberculatus TaxID=210409 RepID=A0A5B7F575_PORTR|nr:hypothetical protein [Portunus trituberculatus]